MYFYFDLMFFTNLCFYHDYFIVYKTCLMADEYKRIKGPHETGEEGTVAGMGMEEF